uniref:Ras-related protein Rab-3 n=1 Tax=Parastrongyloides trichosuri TaxID=131310 RepID=A0A0N4Z015_PARTI
MLSNDNLEDISSTPSTINHSNSKKGSRLLAEVKNTSSKSVSKVVNSSSEDTNNLVVRNIGTSCGGSTRSTFGLSLFLRLLKKTETSDDDNREKNIKETDVVSTTNDNNFDWQETIDNLIDQATLIDADITRIHGISQQASYIMAHTNAVASTGSNAPAAGGQGDNSFDYMFKLLIIGNSSVGKTSFLFRYCDDSFTSAFVSTVGIDFKVKQVVKGDKKVKLQIWDTAGQERYRTITTAYYRGAMGFILMYDITNEESFNSVQDWCTQIKTYSWENAQVVLVGNKCDMEMERVVSTERGRQLADQLGLEFFETSAKTSQNVKNVFDKLVEIICNKMAESLDKNPSQNAEKGIKVDQPTTQKASGQQCNC